MSGSNSDEEPRHLGAVGITAALVLSIIIAGGVAYSSGIESERRNQHPAEYSGYAKAQAERACVGMDGTALFECVYQEVESSQETARTEQDLDAQQGMKFWALMMFFATAITAAITGVGVWYVKRTLDTNSDFLGQTEKTNRLLEKQNEIAHKSHIAQSRAWLSLSEIQISDFKREDRNQFCCTLHATIENTGNSPALNAVVIIFESVQEPSFSENLVRALNVAESNNDFGGQVYTPSGSFRTSKPLFRFTMSIDEKGLIDGKTYPQFWAGVFYNTKSVPGPCYSLVKLIPLGGERIVNGDGPQSFSPEFQRWSAIIS